MSKFIITAYNQNQVTDQDYVRVLKDNTIYIIPRNKIENLPKKTIRNLGHIQLAYMRVASLQVTCNPRKFGFLGIDYKLPKDKE